MKTPKVSVLLVNRNGEKFLKTAIDSILNQTFRDFEFIIIDDYSKDSSVEIIKKYRDERIKLIINETHLGLTKSLNVGIKMTVGEYIARMDADDISCPNRLECQVSYLDNNPDTAIVGSWVDFINNSGKILKTKQVPCSYNEIKNNLIKANQLYHPTLLIRKKVLEGAGYYNEKYYYSQDYELILRIASKYPVANIPESLLKYRVNTKGAISYDSVKQQARFALQARLKALKDYNYPKWQIIYLIKPLISLLTPKPLLLLIYKLIFFRR